MSDPICRECNREPCVCAMSDKTGSMPLRKAFDRAFNLGQTYWQQADHHFISQQNKADATAQLFREFADGICAEWEELKQRAERAEADAERWFKVWELDLRLHRLDRGWWCTRTNLYDDTIKYPVCATRDEAIDAAIAQETKQ